MSPQPVLYFVRHAQGFHNLGIEFHTLPDPRLTPLGEEQCATLRSTFFKDQSHLSLITASPLTRTLHTAIATFTPALTSKHCVPTVLAIPDAQETSDYACDTGSDLSSLTKFCHDQSWPVDLSLLTPTWNHKSIDNRYSPASDAIKARARDCRKLLRQEARQLLKQNPSRPPHIVLVTHGGFLHYLTDDWEDMNAAAGTGWQNTEVRTFQFEGDFLSDEDGEAHVMEMMESRRRRGKEGPMPDHDHQVVLFEECMESWGKAGLQRPDRIGKGEKLGRVVAEKGRDETSDQENGDVPHTNGEEEKMVNGEGKAVVNGASRI